MAPGRRPHTLRSTLSGPSLPGRGGSPTPATGQAAHRPTGPAAKLATPLRGRATPAADARHDRERRMAKGDGARARDGRGVPTAAEPEFVQLLTPDGERVEHPSYAVDFTDEEYRELYRDLVIVRRLDA